MSKIQNASLLGKEGEEIACIFLQNKGYEILACNWIFDRAEIDIIAKNDAILVFVEVKTRKNLHFGNPEDAVTLQKIAQIEKASLAYIETENYQGEVRFDIIAIVRASGKTLEIQHFEDAFFPTN